MDHPGGTASVNRELIRSAFDKLGRGDVSGIAALLTDDSVGHFPEGSLQGKDAIVARLEGEVAVLSSWRLETMALAAENDDVFLRWVLTGTHDGPFEGVAATGKEVTVDGAEHLVLRDGMVVSVNSIVDRMQFATCIGMVPPADTAGDRIFKRIFNGRTKIARALKR